MRQIATLPLLTDGPRSPWTGAVAVSVDEFLAGLPFQPSHMRLWFEGDPAALADMLPLPANAQARTGELEPLPGWRLAYQRGSLQEREAGWLVLEGVCNGALLRVLARLLGGLKPVDRRDLSLTVWRETIPQPR